ncbi:MAG: oxidoreductase [Bacteroidales bacterium]|nr:oxidoreductase [Bacteroidales bacterium]MDT8430835.1 oxidoreductase [Bacteroidales bacterium]
MMTKWTYSDIPSQEGRVAIVTGANSGLGYFTARGLAEKGCEVIMACRNTDKGEVARAALLEQEPAARLKVMELDLSDLGSVHHFADAFRSSYKNLDLLINNAGLMAIPLRRTVQGFEMQFGVNHLGHFALTALLFDLLKATERSRIVNVSSAAHKMGEIRFDDINWEKGYSKWRAYGMSKLANIHFTHELADKVAARGIDIRVVAAHPGYSDSKLIEKGPEMNGQQLMVRAGRFVNSFVAQRTEMGALPQLFAATLPDAVHRGYYGPGGFGGMRGYPQRTYPLRRKVSKDVQERLWALSEKMTGLSFLSK